MENSLAHYGVLGMKWGIRKARKRGENYEYKSRSQKKLQKRLDDFRSKGNGNSEKARYTESKLNMYKNRDRARQKYAERTSVGAAIARTILMTPLGNGSYERMRASGSGRGAAIVAGLLGGAGFLPANIASIAVSKSSEYSSAGTKRHSRK